MGQNFVAFSTNYVLLFLLVVALKVIMSPDKLMTVLLMGCIWVAFAKKNEDPDWNPVVGGIALTPKIRWLVLAGVTAIVFFMIAGEVIVSTLFMYIVGAAIHGVVHT